MIDVHARLTEAFNTLPELQAMKPNYKWGDDMYLNKLIKLYQNNERNPYPLIYNVSNSSVQDAKRDSATYRLSLVLAFRNTHIDFTNEDRWKTSYKTMLFPLASYIEQLFMRGNIFQAWSGEYTLLEFPNYGNGKENETTDIWDALRFDTEITINNRCLNAVFYDSIEPTT